MLAVERLGTSGAYPIACDPICLRFGVIPLFIPKGESQFIGGVENFNC